ncbi:Snoal-like polyketide cyclase family protein [Mycena venus]|uniref:Snoal-like polyketide cyclase family protein n=1 Tax=Mycena venus TaxID=2733690 RepID=A0A8H6YKM7_9AGAR|nr:Snoal-like polyketide cyclase family protein [Mycena venus]
MRASITLLSALFLILTLTGPALAGEHPPKPTNSSDTTPPRPCILHSVSPHQQEEIFYTLVDALYVARTVSEAYTHFVEDFINHNPATVDGIASSFALILHQAFAAPYGWVHYRIDGFNPEPTAVVDVFQFNGSCVVEHWDIIQERPVNSTSLHPLF